MLATPPRNSRAAVGESSPTLASYQWEGLSAVREVEMEVAKLLLVTFLAYTSAVTLAVPCEYDLYVSWI